MALSSLPALLLLLSSCLSSEAYSRGPDVVYRRNPFQIKKEMDFLPRQYPGLVGQQKWRSFLQMVRKSAQGFQHLTDEFSSGNQVPLSLQSVPTWSVQLNGIAQVTGVDTDSNGDLYIFHRGPRVWDYRSFIGNVFTKKNPIDVDVIWVVNNKTGAMKRKLGAGIFYMPHGITVDKDGNIWTTDVALHQVLKFPAGSKKPSLVLGTRLQPGKGNNHFCKPTDVAVASTGEFFVSDGYCNSRILKYSKNGKLLNQWGRWSTAAIPPPFDQFHIAHSLALIEDKGLICLADRENQRIQCFDAGLKDKLKTGRFVKSFQQPEIGRVYAIAYDARRDLLLAVSGDSDGDKHTQSRGLTIDAGTGRILNHWGEKELSVPHDVAVSPDGRSVYVADVNEKALRKVWKFQ